MDVALLRSGLTTNTNDIICTNPKYYLPQCITLVQTEVLPTSLRSTILCNYPLKYLMDYALFTTVTARAHAHIQY
jgi:hypothetical protein